MTSWSNQDMTRIEFFEKLYNLKLSTSHFKFTQFYVYSLAFKR